VRFVVLGRGAEKLTDRSIIVSESTIERYGLFVIIVLVETVFGVAEDLREGEFEFIIMATGLIGLVIGSVCGGTTSI
jgi:low temperature requirement protein LtrA